MRTTLSLDPGLIKELMSLTGAKTKTEAIHLAVSELVRRKKLEGTSPVSRCTHPRAVTGPDDPRRMPSTQDT